MIDHRIFQIWHLWLLPYLENKTPVLGLTINLMEGIKDQNDLWK